MRNHRVFAAAGALLLLLAVYVAHAAASQGTGGLDTKDIDRILGKGTVQDGAYVVDIPRSNLKVTLQGDAVPIGFDLEHEVRWLATRGGARVATDLVLLQAEVNPVLSSLEASGFEVAAIHNHFIEQAPLLIYIHASRTGTAAVLAESIRRALSRTSTPLPAAPAQRTGPALDVRRVQDIVGRKGRVEDGVLSISKGRTGARDHGVVLPPGMGIELLAMFIGTNEHARVAGDLVLRPNEVQRTISTLRAAGFRVAALHNHQLTVEPRIFYLHYAGAGTAEKLARTIRTVFGQLPERL